MLQHGSVTGPTPIPEAPMQQMIAKKIYCAVQPRTAKRLAIELERLKTPCRAGARRSVSRPGTTTRSG